jgi:hypothetical protein
LENVFCSVFELPSLRNTEKRDKTRKVEEKLTSKFLSIFLEKVFDMDFLQKYLYGVFELPSPRNAQKRTKKVKKKKSAGGLVGLGFSTCTGGSGFFWAAPRCQCQRQGALRKKEKEATYLPAYCFGRFSEVFLFDF